MQENNFWQRIRALNPGEKLTFPVFSPRQVKTWRTYVCDRINKKRDSFISVEYSKADETVTFKCYKVRVSEILTIHGQEIYAKVMAGAEITRRDYENLKKELQSFLDEVKLLIKE